MSHFNVWRKVPESDARSVRFIDCLNTKHRFTDILPPTTAVNARLHRSVGLLKLSANGRYFVGAQIISFSFITAHIVSPVQIKAKIALDQRRTFFSLFSFLTRGVVMLGQYIYMYVCVCVCLCRDTGGKGTLPVGR